MLPRGGGTGTIEVKKSVPTWASRAIATAIDDPSWEPLLESLHEGIRAQLATLAVGKRFSELRESEQAALVERSFHESQQNEAGSERVCRFSHRLGKAVNDELLAFLSSASLAGDYVLPSLGEREAQGGVRLAEHPSNSDQMLEIFAKTTLEMLDSSPPEMASTLRLFLNRPLPECLRGSIWLSALTKKVEPGQKSRRGSAQQQHSYNNQLQPPPGVQQVLGKLAPSLDVLLARRCHATLDSCFQELSSRANASFVKQVVSTFLRMLGLRIPANVADSFDNVDLVAFLIVPLVCVFRLSASHRKRVTELFVPAAEEGGGGNHGGHGRGHSRSHSLSHGHGKRDGEGGGVRTQNEIELLDDDASSRSTMEQPHAIEAALYALMEPRHLGLINASEGAFFLVERAPCLGRTSALLLAKDARLASLLSRLREERGGAASPRSPRGGSSSSSGAEMASAAPAASSAATFDAFLHEQVQTLAHCLFVLIYFYFSLSFPPPLPRRRFFLAPRPRLLIHPS